MKRKGILMLAAMTAAGAALALPAKDRQLLDEVALKQVRTLSLDTALIRDGMALATIVAPTEAPWSTAAARLGSGIRELTGVELPLVAADSLPAAAWETGTLVVLGNLLVSSAYARLYHNFFVCADAGYTGSGGYELRSVHEPFHTGRNVLALGAQDEGGIVAAVDRLLLLCREHGRHGHLVLPRVLEVSLQQDGARAPVPVRLTEPQVAAGKEAYEAIYARVGTERAAAHRVAHDAMMYHRTGDEGHFECFRYGLLRHIRYYAEDDYINSDGLGRYDRDFRDSWTWAFVVAWDLLEEHPAWSAEERLLITNHVLRCVLECNVYQNWQSQERVAEWRAFRSITHNHHTWPGLANLFGGWYFQRHYQHPSADDWLAIALGMFGGCKRSSKPWEDSAGYQWIPMCHVLTYSQAAGEPTYVRDGHAAETGKVALMCLDNLGHEPGFGDTSSFTGASRFPHLFSALEYATGDGRFRWALERFGLPSRGELLEPYYTAVAPMRPDDLVGVAVSYLPRPHYDLNGLNPQYFPKANLPFEESFDKLTLRAGWEREDDYLLLDGYSGGSHGHEDCNAIIGYTAAGAHWLVDGEYIRLTPKYHSTVTVIRDGVAVRNPAMARLADAVWFGDGAICRTTIPEYHGIRWTRHLFWQPNRFTAVIDELAAVTPGDYALRCCWRTYGEPTLQGQILTLRQEQARFALLNLSAGEMELVYQRDLGNWPIHHLYQRRSQRLAAGERVVFANVFGAWQEGERPFSARRIDEGCVLVESAGEQVLLGIGGLETPGLSTDASAWMLRPGDLRLAAVTRLVRAGQEPWSSAEASALRVAGPTLVPGVRQSTPVAGQRPLTVVASAPAAAAAEFAGTLSALRARSAEAPEQTEAPVAESAADPLLAWSFRDFPRLPEPLRATGITTDPEPRPAYSPKERLVDGRFTGSTVSCLFPAGAAVTIDLELAGLCTVREVRLRAWEMNDSWHTRERTLFFRGEGGDGAWAPVPGTFSVVGSERWGNNVNTIYALPVNQSATALRIVITPASPECSVYLAEIEVLGLNEGRPPELTAVTTADLDGDGMLETAVGTATGDLVALARNGSELWRVTVGRRITALAAANLDGSGRAAIAYGAAPDLLGIVSPDGEKLREVCIPAYRGIPAEPQNITIADLAGDGSLSIVVGVRSWQYLAYSPSLELRWQHVIYAHSATVAAIADLDGDGRQEIVAGNAYYRLNILDAEGKRRLTAGRFGPEQSAVATADLDGDGRQEVILGTDGGDLIVFDLQGNQLWERNVGDRVTSIIPLRLAGEQTLAVASESGFVWLLAADGTPRWKHSAGAPVRRLVAAPEGLLAMASGAGVARFSWQGEALPASVLSGSVTDGVFLGDLAAVLTADGAVHGLRNQPSGRR
jgi:outer membrane protein assembly factor BamB